jgi:hypothetical protein
MSSGPFTYTLTPQRPLCRRVEHPHLQTPEEIAKPPHPGEGFDAEVPGRVLSELAKPGSPPGALAVRWRLAWGSSGLSRNNRRGGR